MYNRLYSYLAENNILFNKLFGFQAGHSIEYALLELVDQISNTFNDKNCLLGTFIDLSKAFDTVDHKILIQKLRHKRINGKNLSWFKSYLTNRKQYIKYDSNNNNYIKNNNNNNNNKNINNNFEKLNYYILYVVYHRGQFWDHSFLYFIQMTYILYHNFYHTNFVLFFSVQKGLVNGKHNESCFLRGIYLSIFGIFFVISI